MDLLIFFMFDRNYKPWQIFLHWILFLSLKYGPPNLNRIDIFRLWPFWGVETLHLPLVQPDISTAYHGWVGLSGALPKSPRVQSFHIHGGKLPSGNWGTRSSVLPLEEVYFQGWFHSTSNIFSFPFKVPCSTMDCSSSVAGPKQPSMVDSCCSQFQSGVCK